jgi:hypothetical protein
MLKLNPQSGAALLLFLLVFLALSISLIAYSTNPDSIEVAREQKTFQAMAMAKKAVLAHAATFRADNIYPRPGELPQPDTDQDGASDTMGGSNPLIGWFPWKTLETEELTDASGSHLWYAVSADFYNRSGTASHNEPLINPASIGQLNFGAENNVRAAVLIIAPGSVLPDQSRSAADADADAVIQQYLEGENSNIVNLDRFTGIQTANMNDRIMVITVDEIMRIATRNVMFAAQDALVEYFNAKGFFPYAEFDTHCDSGTYGPLPINAGGHTSTIGLLPMTQDINCPYEVLYDAVKADPATADPFYKGLPRWFSKNEWYKFIAYMPAPACAGSTTSNCNGVGFLTLDAEPNIRAMIADTGIELNDVECNGQPPYDQLRAALPADICAYLETNQNTDYDNSYTQPVLSASTNDRFLIVAP